MKKIYKAYSKINVFLNVFSDVDEKTKKHKLESLVLINKKIFDVITIKKSHVLKISYFDKHGHIINFNNDAIKKAIGWFSKQFPGSELSFDIIVKKNIPIGSGLGGESTDIATILTYLFDIYKIKLTPELMLEIALNVGSDVCFFMSKYKFAYVAEYGNEIIPIYGINLDYRIHILSEINSSTKEVFYLFDKQKIQNPYEQKIGFLRLKEIIDKKKYNLLFNNLSQVAFNLYPLLWKEYKILIKRTDDFLILSGSGSAIVRIKK